jgi:hypothetical protein
MELIAHTTPADNIPSKNIHKKRFVSNKVLTIDPSVIDRKNPIHVDVHKTQLIKLPKKFDFDFIHSLGTSKIEP